MSSTVRVIVRGTPSAVPDSDPKLDVMSLRTTSLSVSTFGPFEPSPGNGPAVSSGIAVVTFDPVLDVDDEVVDDDVVAVVPDVAVASDLLFDPQAAATVTNPAPARSRSAPRRSTSRGRSNARPRSWSSMSCVMPPVNRRIRRTTSESPESSL